MIVFELLNMKRLVQNRLVIDTVRLKLDRLWIIHFILYLSIAPDEKNT